MVMPRYLSSLVDWSSSPCIVYVNFFSFFFPFTWRTWHFCGWKDIDVLVSHVERVWRSVWSCSWSVLDLTGTLHAMSSAKSLVLDTTASGKSLMYVRKRAGPNTDP